MYVRAEAGGGGVKGCAGAWSGLRGGGGKLTCEGSGEQQGRGPSWGWWCRQGAGSIGGTGGSGGGHTGLNASHCPPLHTTHTHATFATMLCHMSACIGCMTYCVCTGERTHSHALDAGLPDTCAVATTATSACVTCLAWTCGARCTH